MRYPVAAILLSSCFWPLLATGQTSGPVSTMTDGIHGSQTFGAPPPFPMHAVTGAPYSAEESTERSQTLADGTHISNHGSSVKVFRDSMGRTRTEGQRMAPLVASHAPEAPLIIEINDPLAHVKYVLDTVNKVAHRQQLPTANPMAGAQTANASAGGTISAVAGPGGGGTGAGLGGGRPTGTAPPAAQANSGAPQRSFEKLGTDTMEGLTVQGTRYTTTFPVGFMGNDQPISSVTETWMSPDLKIVILSKSTDPRSGEYTRKVTNVDRTEPSPDLFQAPADFTVVDETGSFTIKW